MSATNPGGLHERDHAGVWLDVEELGAGVVVGEPGHVLLQPLQVLRHLGCPAPSGQVHGGRRAVRHLHIRKNV